MSTSSQLTAFWLLDFSQGEVHAGVDAGTLLRKRVPDSPSVER